MIRNLDRLNSLVPYTVWQENSNAFRFKTDLGKTYEICFCRLLQIGQSDMVYTYFTLIDGEHRGAADCKLGVTVSNILLAYSLEHPSDVLYFCHEGEFDESGRARIFTCWGRAFFRQNPNIATMVICEGGTTKHRYLVAFVPHSLSGYEQYIEAIKKNIDALVDYHIEQIAFRRRLLGIEDKTEGENNQLPQE